MSAILEHEARIVGIRDASRPSLEAIDRRRSQLWTIGFAGLVCFAAGIAVLGSNDRHELGIANTLAFRAGAIALVIVLAVYVMEKEHHLRRLARLIIEERFRSLDLSNRLNEVEMLCQAAKAMNSVLVVDEVLDLILSRAFELLQASSASILLVDAEGTLVDVCHKGGVAADQVEVDREIADQVAREREPLLVEGSGGTGPLPRAESTICVPLVHRDELLGVLELDSSPGNAYTEYDLRAVLLFAEHAAIAVANARLYEAERSLSARLSHQAVHDALTGAANRVLIDDQLRQALDRLDDSGTFTAVLFIDMDNFKRVNDELGHAAGDRILAEIAERLSESTRSGDTIGRLGGDEFVIVCEDLSDPGEAEGVAQRILGGFRRPFTSGDWERMVSASIGVVVCNEATGLSAERLVREADRAMYQAKMEGKGRFVLGTSDAATSAA